MLPSPPLVVLAAGRARRYGGLKPLAPIGPDGEAVLDILASDARAAGFTRIILVLNATTGPEIRAHVEGHWPNALNVSYAIQESPLGTADALSTARELLKDDPGFVVSNADDVYGVTALTELYAHLRDVSTPALVTFTLEATMISPESVSRGVCEVKDGRLVRIVERREVIPTPNGPEARDGLTPLILDPQAPVSMNLWAFTSDVWPDLEAVAPGDTEFVLPDVVAIQLERGVVFTALHSPDPCVGVTHADDLELARACLVDQIASGIRPAHTFMHMPKS